MGWGPKPPHVGRVLLTYMPTVRYIYVGLSDLKGFTMSSGDHDVYRVGEDNDFRSCGRSPRKKEGIRYGIVGELLCCGGIEKFCE